MHVSLDTMVDTLKAAAESSRLRILVLLSRGDLTVSDLTEILGQSQPRVSRHLKLLLDAGLIGRYQEGSWAFFRLTDIDNSRDFVQRLVSAISEADPQVVRDLERLAAVKRKRQDRAAEYFSENAASWDHIRSLHVPDRAVEAALIKLVGKRPFQSMLDLGTGTGRLLEIFAPLYRRGVGIDMSREMLSVARANLDKAGIANAQVRQGDIFSPPVERNAFDLVTIHQVLHYLDDPARAIAEAARLLRPSGRLIVVDFAPHALEFLRDQHAHMRLGFSDRQMSDWFAEAGLDLEDSQEFEPRGGNEARLTVKLWLGRDRRLLIADPSNDSLPAKAYPMGETA
ncbi:metalloregulator ArsR/SmtB family transcription factor [Mesorhizobium sp. ESP-6-4]|uniref:ArsR/SmtB family transcription factor n=1 Tax=unclassified Mesorhizobium TaxID=325217 RepID=UPI000BAEC22E|nr:MULTISPECIES: metalloregulator ArsR/SmtB family transcription factor [unclassified Mesorhizobium]MBZ9657868.1 metalloregulator ArsR/SmtB family transcription factor [Mesorhizobium sp. ESP-6-4]MBZ9732583.1 metalloregulator ArsR/SmtB family transcription factor [Mesorhizobium sp. CA9]MBZ9824022.1 metalloregulator ArsR/SmtB family transcription factor [Mesorhizobium sp. CA18]MBZ9830250.1 metalloregulator ArsR/SmtB family transcription factor [Mesorhizobium sp. CA2]MBZ9835652.1 metalloregulator